MGVEEPVDHVQGSQVHHLLAEFVADQKLSEGQADLAGQSRIALVIWVVVLNLKQSKKF